jgi:hypothetical protein
MMSAHGLVPGVPPTIVGPIYVGDLPEFQKLGLDYVSFTIEEVPDASDAEDLSSSPQRISPERVG